MVDETRSILVVDDRDANLLAIEVSLEPLRRGVVCARSGHEALANLLDRDFVLIILDISMPMMDGFETAELIRSRARSSETPIIFVTGLDWDLEMSRRAYRLGAVDFLTTPIDPETLRAKAAVFVSLDERTMELRRAEAHAHERELLIQRRQFEADLAAVQMRELAEANRRKDEFLAILGHELRNPLQPIRSAIDLLKLRPTEPVPARLLATMSGQLDHIQRLVDDLLDVARINSNRIELQCEMLSVRDLIAETLIEMQPAVAMRQHVVIADGDGSPQVLGDRARLVQVLANLISNATRYTDRGGEIRIQWGCTSEQVIIRVSDNGRGIAPTMLERIFEMFVQERVAKNGSEGLGLGLGLAKRLVDLHGGSIRATSPGLGQGSTFEVSLPLGVEQTGVDAVEARWEIGDRS